MYLACMFETTVLSNTLAKTLMLSDPLPNESVVIYILICDPVGHLRFQGGDSEN